MLSSNNKKLFFLPSWNPLLLIPLYDGGLTSKSRLLACWHWTSSLVLMLMRVQGQWILFIQETVVPCTQIREYNMCFSFPVDSAHQRNWRNQCCTFLIVTVRKKPHLLSHSRIAGLISRCSLVWARRPQLKQTIIIGQFWVPLKKSLVVLYLSLYWFLDAKALSQKKEIKLK